MILLTLSKIIKRPLAARPLVSVLGLRMSWGGSTLGAFGSLSRAMTLATVAGHGENAAGAAAETRDTPQKTNTPNRGGDKLNQEAAKTDPAQGTQEDQGLPRAQGSLIRTKNDTGKALTQKI